MIINISAKEVICSKASLGAQQLALHLFCHPLKKKVIDGTFIFCEILCTQLLVPLYNAPYKAMKGTAYRLRVLYAGVDVLIQMMSDAGHTRVNQRDLCGLDPSTGHGLSANEYWMARPSVAQGIILAHHSAAMPIPAMLMDWS